MPSYQPLAVVYGTDEDVCIRAEGDFAVLLPKGQKRASGTDGTTSGWVLTSAAVNFATQGVVAGMVVQVSIPAPTKTASPGVHAELFAVGSVSGLTVTLRRVGESSGVGQPPAASSGVAFLVQTFAPQIDDVSYDLNRRFGVDPLIPARTPSRFYDIRETNQVCVLTLLERQYVAQARMAGDKGDDFWAKAKAFAQERDDVLDRLAIHWTNISGWGYVQAETTTTRFGTRLSR